jgi:hypothetical protein
MLQSSPTGKPVKERWSMGCGETWARRGWASVFAASITIALAMTTAGCGSRHRGGAGTTSTNTITSDATSYDAAQFDKTVWQ